MLKVNLETEHISKKLTIRNFILESVNIQDLNDDDNLFETGIVNSLFAIQLMTFLEKTFGIEVTMDDLSLENFESVNATSSFVHNKQIQITKLN